VRRGPSEAQLAKAWLHQQARLAALALAERSHAQVVALLEEAARLPRQDVSMQLGLPWLLSPALERLRATIAEGDPDELDAAVPAALRSRGRSASSTRCETHSVTCSASRRRLCGTGRT
jgi:hypothetical protein